MTESRRKAAVGMNEISPQQWHRILTRGTAIGFVGIFLIVFCICLIDGLTIIEATGVALIPAIQACWFYGGTAMVVRAAYNDQEPKNEAPPVPLRLLPRNESQKVA